MDGWIDGKEWTPPQKHCCLITSLFRSATTVINNPTAGALGTRQHQTGECSTISHSAEISVGMIMVSVAHRKSLMHLNRVVLFPI